MIKELKIELFKNISEITLNLSKINILVGTNNSGKSSILQAVQFIVTAAQTIRMYDYQNTVPIQKLLYLPTGDAKSLAKNNRLTQNHGFAITIHDESEKTLEMIVTKGKNDNVKIDINGNYEFRQAISDINHPYSIFVPGLAGIPALEEYKSTRIVKKAAARGDANNFFRNILYRLSDPINMIQWSNFKNDLKQLFPDVYDIHVGFHDDRDEYIDLKISKYHSSGNLEFPINAAGTGLLQAIQILSYVHLFNPKVLVLDEPDAHLHPNNQRKLTELLMYLCETRDLQLIIATHSRHILDELGSYSNVCWLRNGKLVEDAELSRINLLMDLGALDRGETNFKKCVVLTEDSDTDGLKAILESSGFKMYDVEIWPYKGCTKLDTAFALADFIKEYSSDTEIVVHRDRDYLEADELNKYKEKAGKYGLHPFITAGTDVESHFISAEHIQELYPQLSIQEVGEIIDQAFENTKDKSRRLFTDYNADKEMKELRQSGKGFSIDDIVEKYRSLFEGNYLDYYHGKTVLKQLKSLLQHKLKENIRLFKSTSHISNKELTEISSRIWVSNN